MRFGIKTAPQHTTWDDMLDVWQHADEIELFESAWNFDHFYPIFSDSTGPCLEAWTMLAAMAQATQPHPRRRAWSPAMIYRHPAVLANMAATVDVDLATAGSSSASAPGGTSRSATRTASSCRR